MSVALSYGNNIICFGNVAISAGVVEPPFPFKTVKIGNQIWMAENLTGDDNQGGVYSANVASQSVNFGTQFYYTQPAAVRMAQNYKGWHLPSKADYDELFNYGGTSSEAGKRLKSTTGWTSNGNGTDDFGFSGFPCGWSESGLNVSLLGDQARFWTSTSSNSNPYNFYLYRGFDQPVWENNKSPDIRMSVRLVKDA